MADNIAYAKYRMTLLICKRFWNVCNTNDVQGLRRFQNLGLKKCLLKYLHQKLQFDSKK